MSKRTLLMGAPAPGEPAAGGNASADAAAKQAASGEHGRDEARDTRGWTKRRSLPSGSLVGQTVGSYRITRLLGEGGIGAVYLGEHPIIGVRVAIKMLHDEIAESPSMVERFVQEAKAANLILSPHIVRVTDFGALPDGRPYAVMEYLEGKTFDDLLTELGTVPWPRVAELCRQVAVGTAAAHAAGILHRDLKPENLFVQATEGGELVRILDFGIAKLLESHSFAHDPEQAKATAAGQMIGTPMYCSPEQATGKPLTPATDIYALGAVAYELLSGQPIFEGNPVEILIQKASQPIPPIQSLRPELPAMLAALVMQMLERAPEARPASMSDVAHRLGAVLGSGTPLPGISASTLVSGPLMGAEVFAPRTPIPPAFPTPPVSSGTPVAMTSGGSLAPAPAGRSRRAAVLGLLAAAALGTIGAVFVVRSGGSGSVAVAKPSATEAPSEKHAPARTTQAPPEQAASDSVPAAPASVASAAKPSVTASAASPPPSAEPVRKARPSPPAPTTKRAPARSSGQGKIVNPFD